MDNDFNYNISYSALNLFLNNERWFYYQYILKQEPDTLVETKWSDYGKCVHECIENNFFNSKDIKDIYIKYELGEKGYGLNEIVRNVNFAKLFIKKYISKSYDVELLLEFLHNERNINCNFKGFIDLYDKKNEIIVDWKTSTYRAKKVIDYKKQITFYALLFFLKFNKIPKKGYVVFTKEQKIFSQDFNEELILKMKDYVYDILFKIKEKKNKEDFEISNNFDIFNPYKKIIYQDKMKEINVNIKVLYDDKMIKICMDNWDTKFDLVFDKEFSYLKDETGFARKVLAKRGREWDGIKRFYDKKNKILPIGFLNRVKKLLNFYKNYRKNVKIEYNEVNLGEKKQIFFVPYEKNNNIKLREYQKNIIEEVLKK